MDLKEARASYSVRPEQRVPMRYKKTAVGVIPEDWTEVTLFTLAGGTKERFDDGDWIEAEYLSESGVRLIQTGNIGIGVFVDKEAKKYISPHSFELLRCKALQEGDLLICRLAEPAGRACLMPTLEDDKAITAVDVTIFRPVEALADRRYLLQLFGTRFWFAAVNDRCGGSTRTRIARGELGKIPIPLPPTKAEQKAIAEALSDADALIESLEQLLAKKRHIKQGTMQELLTGKQRLPGFSGEWAVKQLVDICYMKSGEGITSADIDELSEFPCYGGNGLRGFSERYTHDGHYALIGRQGALCGNVLCVDGRFFASEHAIVVTPKKETDIQWLSLVLARMNLNQYSESSAQPGLSVAKLLTLECIVPALVEQSTIAETLADMDAEIAALDAKLAKARQLKQGMMQELLTGRTRLV